MPLRGRRARPPAAVLEVVSAATPRERVLGWATTADGEWLVATDRALWVPRRAMRHRIGWEQVDVARWDRDTSQLSVRQAAPVGGTPQRWLLRVDDPGDLLVVVRERVNATVVLSHAVDVGVGDGVRIVARRPPGSSSLSWTVSVGRGVDVADPQVRAVIDGELARLRAELGV
jgi:hypothetical protein